MKANYMDASEVSKPFEILWHPAFIAFLFATIYCLPGLSLFIKVIFFGKSMSLDGHGINYALYSDGGLQWTPQLAYLAHQLQHYTLQGVDFLTDNGASEFFVRPNCIIFYPLAILLTFVMKAYTFKLAALVYFLLIYIHVFLATLFLNLLGRRFFNLRKMESIFFSMVTVFSYIYACNLYELHFFMAFALFSMILYVMLSTPFINKKFSLILLSFIYFSYIFVGYLPLPLFGLCYSFVFSLCYIFYINPDLYPNKYNAVKRLLIPLVIGCCFAAPGCLAIVKFVHYASSPGLKGLAYAAYSLPEHIKDVVLFLLTDPTHPAAELRGGMLKFNSFYALIWILFLIISGKTNLEETLISNKLFKATLLFAATTLLISFGSSLHLSTLFYYLIPAFSDMHQYQRYFGFGILFFAFATTIALKSFIETHPIKLLKKVLFVLFTIVAAMSIYLEFYNTSLNSSPITEGALAQYFLLLITYAFMLFLGKIGRWQVATFFGILMALHFIYPIQTPGSSPPTSSNIALDRSSDENKNLITFLKRHSNKELIKYANLSNNLFTFVPLNYPWTVANQIKLSTYLGYEPHLSQDNAYRSHVRTYGSYETEWLRRTGAEFIIYDQEAFKRLKDFIDNYADPSIAFHLSSGEVVMKLKPSFSLYPAGYSENVFDNGYIAVLNTHAPTTVSNFTAESSEIKFNLTINDKNSKLVLPFFANRHLYLYLNDQKISFKKDRDIYYYDFNEPGEYSVSIKYHYLPLTIFLYSMIIYYTLLLIIGAYYLGEILLRKWLITNSANKNVKDLATSL